jgi:hypothetical protein
MFSEFKLRNQRNLLCAEPTMHSQSLRPDAAEWIFPLF